MLTAQNDWDHYRKKTIMFNLHPQENILEIDIASQTMETHNRISRYSRGSARMELTADQNEYKYSSY